MKLLLFLLLITATAKGQINASKLNSKITGEIYLYKPLPIGDRFMTLNHNAHSLGRLTTKDSILTIYVSKDSLIKYLVEYIDRNGIVKYIADSSGTGEPSYYTELKTLREENKRLAALNDSLQSKINKLMEYHYYSCEIISSLRPNGTLANRRQYHRAIRAYFERYGMAKRKFKNDKK